MPRGGVEVQLYSCFNLGARWGGCSTSSPSRFTPRERTGTYCREGWVGPRTPLDGYGKPRAHRDSIPGTSNPYRVAVPTALFRLTSLSLCITNCFEKCKGLRRHSGGQRAAGCSTPINYKAQQALLMVDALSHISMKYRVTIGFFFNARLPKYTRYVHHCTSLAPTPLVF